MDLSLPWLWYLFWLKLSIRMIVFYWNSAFNAEGQIHASFKKPFDDYLFGISFLCLWVWSSESIRRVLELSHWFLGLRPSYEPILHILLVFRIWSRLDCLSLCRNNKSLPFVSNHGSIGWLLLFIPFVDVPEMYELASWRSVSACWGSSCYLSSSLETFWSSRSSAITS